MKLGKVNSVRIIADWLWLENFYGSEDKVPSDFESRLTGFYEEKYDGADVFVEIDWWSDTDGLTITVVLELPCGTLEVVEDTEKFVSTGDSVWRFSDE